MRRQPETLRRFRALHHLLDRPLLPLGRLAVNLLRREAVEGFVIGGVHRDELGRQMRRKLGDRQAVAFAVPVSSSQ